MDIIYKKVEDLKPYENNPRKNGDAVPYVANSIKMFGFRVPVVIDKNDVIVCGHTRYEAAKTLGILEVPCILAEDLTDSQIKAYRIADNKTQELSKWDYDLLYEELQKIMNIDMTAFGFSGDINYNDEDFEEKGSISRIDRDGGEIDLSSFSDERFNCVCPCCGFRFDEKEA